MTRDAVTERAHPIVGLIGWIALVAAAAALGARASIDAAAFYGTLSLPTWAPPAGVFGPVWTILYAAMAVSAWLVWKRRGWHGAGGALALFCVQLALNALWSWLFFAWHRGQAALVDLAVLWVVVLVATVLFFRVSKLAGALLIPYLLWLSFAGALNYTVLQRNPAQLALAGRAPGAQPERAIDKLSRAKLEWPIITERSGPVDCPLLGERPASG